MAAVVPIGVATTCRDCGAPIALVRIVPNILSAGQPRKRIPLDARFDPDSSDIPASHALTAGRSQCRPITADDPMAPGELPALTHFATCPGRRLARTHHHHTTTPAEIRQDGARP